MSCYGVSAVPHFFSHTCLHYLTWVCLHLDHNRHCPNQCPAAESREGERQPLPSCRAMTLTSSAMKSFIFPFCYPRWAQPSESCLKSWPAYKVTFLLSSLNSSLWITAPSQLGPFCSLSPRKRPCLQIWVSSKDFGPNHLALTHQACLVSGYANFQAFYEMFNKCGYPSRGRKPWKKVHVSQEILVFLPQRLPTSTCTLNLGQESILNHMAWVQWRWGLCAC